MVLFIPIPERFDWKTLMEEAKREVAAKVQRRELTTKGLEAALDLLRAAAMRACDEMLAKGDHNAPSSSHAVAQSVQALAFVLNALDRACYVTARIAEATDKEALLGAERGDIRRHGHYATNIVRKMSLPFLRGRAALDIWMAFLLETRLAPDAPLAPVLNAMNETAHGLPTDFFRHPEQTLGVSKVDSLHDQVRRLAVMAVEALLKAEALDHGTLRRGAKVRACEQVAKAFPPHYRTPSSKRAGVTARHVAQWCEDFGPLLRGGEARGAQRKGFTQWHRDRWEAAPQMLRGEHPQARFEAKDAAQWRAVAAGWCDAIGREIAVFQG